MDGEGAGEVVEGMLNVYGGVLLGWCVLLR